MTGIDFINIEKKRIEERREELDKIYSVEITPRASNKKRYELLGNS